MKVACLQFAPKLGESEYNMQRATQLLDENAPRLVPLSDDSILWLVLPEMAFSGYNFPNLSAIKPHLEPTTSGKSTQWAQSTARKYRCYVTVGYPETTALPNSDIEGPYYNSTVTVSPSGQILANVRKHFLYYTDETWASEGVNTSLAPPSLTPAAEPTPGPAARAIPPPDSEPIISPPGFFSHDFGAPGLGKVSMGICMDINNYRFLSPFSSYEFAHHVLASSTPLTVLSTAWLTHLLPAQLLDTPTTPDGSTIAYWVERFHPLKEAADREGRAFTVVVANRAGTEDGEKGLVCFAGSSTVLRFVPGGRVEIFDVCGKATEEVMIVDLGKNARPKFALQRGS